VINAIRRGGRWAAGTSQPALGPDEEIVLQCQAGRVDGFSYLMGPLILTNQRLIFRPNKFLRPALAIGGGLDLRLTDILRVERDTRWRPFREFSAKPKLRVVRTGSKASVFQVPGVDEWIARISSGMKQNAG
jgi:hypothetical protein